MNDLNSLILEGTVIEISEHKFVLQSTSCRKGINGILLETNLIVPVLKNNLRYGHTEDMAVGHSVRIVGSLTSEAEGLFVSPDMITKKNKFEKVDEDSDCIPCHDKNNCKMQCMRKDLEEEI
jgi:hypothetical protein